MADSNFVPWMAVVVWHKNMLIRFGIPSWSRPRLGFVHKNHCQVNVLNCVFFHGGGGQVTVHQNKKDEINLCFL